MRLSRKWYTIKVVFITSIFWLLFQNVIIFRPSITECKDKESNHEGSESFMQRFLNRFVRSYPNGPGEMGAAVVIPEEKQAEAKKLFSVNSFNLLASDMISINRSLPDNRLDSCRTKNYDVSEINTSVVIVFHNEAWSTLLRTIHSVINRSPGSLLKEIILVDDASERDYLKKRLDDYVSALPIPVKILRQQTRGGLIRARLRGAAQASGTTITFLDAHCEAAIGWLEPLLDIIKRNRRAVVCPVIDVINDDTFEYVSGSDGTWGGFTWKLNFRWFNVPNREDARRNYDRSLPLRTPTMAGGLFTIDRNYFYEIGSYDSGMEIWGGENLEMSFRVWMCGGELLIVTCSRVGHVFRKYSPYSWPGGVSNILNRNHQRTAHVWMDRYREFYFKINPGAKNTDYGDIQDRSKLRKKLNCKSFQWYLTNIYPESLIPVHYYSLGQVQHMSSGKCMDTLNHKASEPLGLGDCHGLGGNQLFTLNHWGGLQSDEMCAEINSRYGPVNINACNMESVYQKFFYDKKTYSLKHENTGYCLGGPNPKEGDTISLHNCDDSEILKWRIENMDWLNYDSHKQP